jgi:hypothetical protein
MLGAHPETPTMVIGNGVSELMIGFTPIDGTLHVFPQPWGVNVIQQV